MALTYRPPQFLISSYALAYYCKSACTVYYQIMNVKSLKYQVSNFMEQGIPQKYWICLIRNLSKRAQSDNFFFF